MAESTVIHGTAVAFNGRAALIIGASGSGKSSLALQLIALGCDLVADDQVALNTDGDVVYASRPQNLPKLIEARGVGLLPAPMVGPTRVALCVDMDLQEKARLPEDRCRSLLGRQIKQICRADTPHFPAAILLYLKS